MKPTFFNGMTVRCRTGRYVEHLDEPDWEEWRKERLFVQGNGDNALVTLADRNWAEYLASDFCETFNCFEAEGYYLEIDPGSLIIID